MEAYLDASATTPVDPRVKEAMDAVEYANPSSLHAKGQEAREAVERSRIALAKALDCRPAEIFFTSGGTESVNWALKGVRAKHIITTKIEHHAVLETCEHLRNEGAEVTYVPVGKDGVVNPEDIKNAITPLTRLISVIYVNNELGTIQPIREIGEIAKKHNILFHVDACQAGLLDLDVKRLQCDLLTLNASKLGGPKGVGLLYVRFGVKLTPLLHGGGQERGMRSGTENVPAIVGFAKAVEIIQSSKEQETMKLFALQTRLEEGLKRLGGRINCESSPRVPSITSVTFKGVEAESLLLQLSDKGVYVSTGSACATKSLEPSHVLKALGFSDSEAHGTLRFSLSWQNTAEEVAYTLKCVKEVLDNLRAAVAR